MKILASGDTYECFKMSFDWHVDMCLCPSEFLKRLRQYRLRPLSEVFK